MAARKPESFRSSGNPFADLGMADADTRLAKAQLAQRITAVMRERDLTQAQIAELLEVDQPQVSRISRGQLKDFSIERLMLLVTRLNQDVEIIVRENPESSRPARLVVRPAEPDDAHALVSSGPAARGVSID